MEKKYRLNPKKLILFDISESSLYTVNNSLEEINHHNIEISVIIGNACNISKLENILINPKTLEISFIDVYDETYLGPECLAKCIRQFGSRLMGGKDSSSARYIFTQLGIWSLYPMRTTVTELCTKQI